jgi:hypothetical protein
MARKDRHSLFGGRMEFHSLFVERGSQGQRHNQEERKNMRTAGSELRPVFFSSTLWDEDRQPDGTDRFGEKNWKGTDSFVKGLILAQNERWRRGLGMQVERAW